MVLEVYSSSSHSSLFGGRAEGTPTAEALGEPGKALEVFLGEQAAG